MSDHNSPGFTSASGSISSARVYAQLAIYLAGVLIILAMELFFNHLNDELNGQLENEQARLSLGEVIILDLEQIESAFYQMAITTNERAQRRIFRQMQERIDNLALVLAVLEKGGVVERVTALNIESQEVMRTNISYQRPDSDSYVLEVIDLYPRLEQFQQEGEYLLELLIISDLAERSGDREAYIESIVRVKTYLRTLPQLFVRTMENANRLFYLSQKQVDDINRRVTEQRGFNQQLQLILTSVVVFFILSIGFRLLRQVQESNNNLGKITRELEFQKFALDQHAIVSATDTEGRIIYANNQFCTISGYSRAELLGNDHRLVKSNEHPPGFYQQMWETISTGKVWSGEIKNRNKAGREYWVSATIVPLCDEDGKPFQYISIRSDITERKQMEQQLTESNRFLQRLTDTMGEGVYVLDRGGRCIFINPKALQLLGFEREEIIGSNIHNFIHHHNQNNEAVEEQDCPIIQTIQRMENYSSDDELFFRRDGRAFPVSINAVPIYEGEEFYGHVAVFQDISHRRESENRIRVARDEAEQANQAKSQFLANMSHEIRTPMNAIIGMSHLALQTGLNHQQRNYIDKIHRAANSLLRLINDILDLSKVEAGKMELEQSSFSLHELLDDLASVLAIRVEEKGLELLFDVAPDVPNWLVGDEMRLNQILLNLCNNAIKFTGQGEITISVGVVYRTAEMVSLHFRVKDTGIGVTAEQKSKLFKPFTQADTTTTRRYGGTGLGLSICKRLVALMQGKIWVESEPNAGSIFHFTANLTSKSGVDAPDEKPQWLYGRRVLVIDDNPAASAVYASILQKRGAMVDCAESVEQANRLLELQQPDVILLEWEMAGKGAENLLSSIASYNPSEPPAIVAVTPHRKWEIARSQTNSELAIAHTLTRPVTPFSLLGSVAAALKLEFEPAIEAKPRMQGLSDAVTRLAGAAILLVEDNEFNQEVARDLLHNNGIHVTLAANGAEALARLNEMAFDGVLMDCQMPVMDGYEAARQIRLQPAFTTLPIIAMTANVMTEEIKRMMEAGMDDHIAKPVHVHDMFTTMAKWIKPASPELPGQTQSPIQIPAAPQRTVANLDAETAIKRLSGDRTIWLKLLNQFVLSEADAVRRAVSVLESQQYEEARRIMHTLKGTAASIGATTLHRLAESAETELRTTPENGIEQAEALQACLDLVLNDIASLVAENTAPVAAGEMDSGQLEPLLAELEAKLADYDSESEELMVRIKQLAEAGPLSDALEDVASAIARYSYEEALEKLQQLEKGL